jgi:LPXTG-motif cell wall-anchored protein
VNTDILRRKNGATGAVDTAMLRRLASTSVAASTDMARSTPIGSGITFTDTRRIAANTDMLRSKDDGLAMLNGMPLPAAQYLVDFSGDINMAEYFSGDSEQQAASNVDAKQADILRRAAAHQGPAVAAQVAASEAAQGTPAQAAQGPQTLPVTGVSGVHAPAMAGLTALAAGLLRRRRR